MTTALSILAWTVLVLSFIAGTLLNVVGLFGNWIMLAGGVLFWCMTGFVHFGAWGLAAMTAFAVLGEVLETVLAGYGAKRFGGSRGSIWAALVGCIAGSIFGTPFFPVIGTLVGACLGAFAFAAAYEIIQHERGAAHAARVGIGAALGKIGGLLAKFACGAAILIAAFLTY